MLTVLADKGYKVDNAKLQYCQKEVLYTGQTISQNGQQITPQRPETIAKTPKPMTVREMQQFLGLCNYCRAWVFDYSTYASPLLGTLKEAQKGNRTLTWTTEMNVAFKELKEAISTAPVLGIPDYKNIIFPVLTH
ncbi:uncharacterized protein [Ambystoma mexicanum]|uniref:uncharacterized protein n=1 Tax=Ambystoma mexicanum TaxID=8296 RepID=UPI0037E97AB5